MDVARGFGAFVAFRGVGGIRFTFGGCKGHRPIGGCRAQRTAMRGMPDIREKTNQLSCCSAFHYTPPHCTNNLIKHFNSMPESGVAEMVLTK
ncbi:MAG TPA: hypothetical protein VEN30_11215 [Paraburkholderia sp.]|nr:hypothetical protein [Paraburkholderia sp.]